MSGRSCPDSGEIWFEWASTERGRERDLLGALLEAHLTHSTLPAAGLTSCFPDSLHSTLGLVNVLFSAIARCSLGHKDFTAKF